MTWVAVIAVALSVLAAVPPSRLVRTTGRGRLVQVAQGAGVAGPGGGQVANESDWMTRHRLVWSILAGLGAFALLRGPSGAVAGAVLGVGCWLVISRAEPAHQRAEREELQRDLPHVVRLLAAALAAGASPVTALAAIAQAMPGVVERRLARVVAQLRLGADPAEVWRDLAAEPALAPLGRSLARAHLTGAPVAIAVERLAEDLARSARADVEDRARAVGVRAAVPLGLCLLPAFVLIGIVPLVAGLFSQFSF